MVSPDAGGRSLDKSHWMVNLVNVAHHLAGDKQLPSIGRRFSYPCPLPIEKACMERSIIACSLERAKVPAKQTDSG